MVEARVAKRDLLQTNLSKPKRSPSFWPSNSKTFPTAYGGRFMHRIGFGVVAPDSESDLEKIA